jgi:hypothetical protein
MTDERDWLREKLRDVVAALSRLSLPDARLEYKRLLAEGHQLRLRLIRHGSFPEIVAFDDATVPSRKGEGRRAPDSESTPAEAPAPMTQIGRGFQLPRAFVEPTLAPAPQTTANSPTVFIQYARVDDDYRKLVKALADHLRQDGITSEADVYDRPPELGLQTWMERQIRDNAFVLVACSDANQRRFEKREEPPTGAGATWEAQLIIQELFENNLVNSRFIPVTLRPEDEPYVPRILKQYDLYRVYLPDDYDGLRLRLLGRPRTVRPPVSGVTDGANS